MSYKALAKDWEQGNSGTIRMVDRSTGVVSTPVSVRSDTLYLESEAQGFHANADGVVVLEAPPRRGARSGSAGRKAPFTVKAGVYYPYRFVKVWDTGTTLAAADLILVFEPY